MSAQMAVLALKDTGHVLAAAPLISGAAPPTLQTLAGDAFPLRPVRRTGPPPPPPPAPPPPAAPQFLLPADLLELKTTALDRRVLGQPHAFAIDGGNVVGLPAGLVPQAVVLTPQTVTVSLAAAGKAPPALIAVRGTDPGYAEQRVQSGSFETAKLALELDLTIVPKGPAAGLESGRQCAVAVAVAGFRIACFAATVT